MDATTVYNKSESSVKLIKTSKGYNWEIKVYGDDMKEIHDKVEEEENRLREVYQV